MSSDEWLMVKFGKIFSGKWGGLLNTVFVFERRNERISPFSNFFWFFFSFHHRESKTLQNWQVGVAALQTTPISLSFSFHSLLFQKRKNFQKWQVDVAANQTTQISLSSLALISLLFISPQTTKSLTNWQVGFAANRTSQSSLNPTLNKKRISSIDYLENP